MDDQTARPARGTAATIALLALCYCYAMIDRQVLSVVTGALKADIHLDDFAIGILLGPAFALSYILFGIPFAVLADRWSRRATISAGLVVWSIGTVATGFAGSFGGLFAARAVTGAGESALVPSAHAIIADSVPRRQLARVLALFGWGASLGIGLSSIVGGLLLARFGEHPLGWLEGFAPWQQVYIVLGLPGFVIAALILRLRSGGKGAKHDSPEAEAFGAFMRSRWRLIAANYGVFGLNNVITYCTLVWSLPYAERQFHSSPAEVGAVFGAATIIGPVLGSFLIAALVDRLYSRGVHDAHYRVFAVLALIAAPICLAGFWIPVEAMFWAGLVANVLTFNAAFATGASALQVVTPTALRARVSGGLVSFVNFAGAVVGPPLVGYLVTHVFHDDARLGDAMALVIGGCVAMMLPLALYAARQTRAVHAQSTAAGASI